MNKTGKRMLLLMQVPNPPKIFVIVSHKLWNVKNKYTNFHRPNAP
jgi:hypothetical protein